MNDLILCAWYYDNQTLIITLTNSHTNFITKKTNSILALDLTRWLLGWSAVGLLQAQTMLKKLIHWPANRCGGYLVYHASIQTSKVSRNPLHFVNFDQCTDHSSYPLLLCLTAPLFMSVQEGLGYVKGRGDRRRQGPSSGTRQHVGEGVVLSRVIEDILERLVRDKVNHLKGNVHAELRCVAAVERSYSLIAIYSSDTVKSTSVGGVVHLEALLHNCKQKMIASSILICMVANRKYIMNTIPTLQPTITKNNPNVKVLKCKMLGCMV